MSHEQAVNHQVKHILQEQLAKFSQQVNPDLEAKTNLLKSDPALYQLYNDLVVGKLITAEEFWANRFGNGSVKGQPLKAGEEQQEIGLPSAFLVRQAKQVFPDHIGCLIPNFQSQVYGGNVCKLIALQVGEKMKCFSPRTFYSWKINATLLYRPKHNNIVFNILLCYDKFTNVLPDHKHSKQKSSSELHDTESSTCLCHPSSIYTKPLIQIYKPVWFRLHV